jgi:Reverse transcriptase (RNA-dependent DNA polymerase)
VTLARMLRKSDFRDYTSLQNDVIRRDVLASAADTAENLFHGSSPLTSIKSNSKTLYQTKDIVQKLVLRKLRSNIHHVVSLKPPDRNFVITNLVHFLSEGVPYRLYRLDIRSFYESFRIEDVQRTVNDLERLSPLSKRLITELFSFYRQAGGTGLPRGMTLSSTLSEILMKTFDAAISCRAGVYFYYRYVDDIVIITNGTENAKEFLKEIQRSLPQGLALHDKKKRICEVERLHHLRPTKRKRFEFDYLGYRFVVFDPANTRRLKSNQMYRELAVDIAAIKIAKIKTRIVRSFFAFLNDNDFSLLSLRLKYLTSNISVKDLNRNTHKLAGIYHNYPHITITTAQGLSALDRFLRFAVTSKRGRLFSRTGRLLTNRQRRTLLGFSFTRGHQRRIFSYFSPVHISRVIECWSHGK